MSEIFLIIVLYIIISVVIIVCWQGLQHLRNRLIITLIPSAIFTLLTIGYFNTTPFFLSEEVKVLSFINPFLSEKPADAVALADNPFILIDIANQEQLLGSGVEEDSVTRRSATDRQKLAEFLEWLNSRKAKFGQVVCDVIFQQQNGSDPRLLAAIEPIKDKVMLAGTNSLPAYNLSLDSLFNVPEKISYPVDIMEYDGMYFSHKLRNLEKAEGIMPEALPYKLYLWRKNLSSRASNVGFGLELLDEYSNDESKPSKRMVINNFIPKLVISDEDVTGVEISEGQTLLEKFFTTFFPKSNETEMRSFKLRTVQLADALTSEGKTELDSLFAQYTGKDPIILIANFSDPQKDTHTTAGGPMHGSLILMNVYFNLLAGRHFIGLGYIIYLFIAYSVIFSLLLHHHLGFLKFGILKDFFKKYTLKAGDPATSEAALTEIDDPIENAPEKAQHERLGTKLLHISTYWLNEIFISNLHYWLLVLVIIGAEHFFGQLINIAVALAFLSACSVCLTTAKKFTHEPEPACKQIEKTKP